MSGGGEEETVEPLETVLPMEETIEALLDHLLPPLLSARESIALPPSDHQQDIVAKQMHAIVILCNYYHRKQFQKLKFLCFESFCKIACIFKPTLLMYMRYMHRSEKDLEVLKNISKTEKMILDACDICNALDALKDSPDIEGWPISKVAVFLVSPTKEMCLLELCSTSTRRHWLLVDKNLEAPFKNVTRKGNTRTYALSKERTSGGTSKSDDVIEEGFEQLAFSAVMQETGISSSDLSILERHVTYSLDRERTSTLLYIMKYGKIVNKELVEVPISDVINSAKGPIVKKGLPFVTTQVVEYFHILPYIEFIADWLSRDTTHVGSLPMPRKDFMDEDHSFESDRIPAKEDHEHNGDSGLVEKKVNFQKAKMIPIKLETIKSNRFDLTSLHVHGSSGGICNPNVLDGLVDMKAKELSDRSLQNEGSLHSKKKTKDIILYYRKGSGSSTTGSSPANYSCKVVHEKHSLEPDRKLGMKDSENKKADFTEHLVNNQNKEMSNSENEIVKNVADLPSTNIPSRAITKSENTTGCSGMEPDGSVTMKSCSVNYEPFQNGQTQDNLTGKKVTTKNANIVDGACINGSSGPNSSCMEPGRLTSKSQIINDKHCQSVQTQENALMNDKNSGNSPKSLSISYEYSRNGQAQVIVTGKKDATKNTKEVDGTCIGGSSGPISSCMESDRLTTHNQIINDKDHQSGQTQEDVFMHNTNIGVSLEFQSINYECFQNGQTKDTVANKKDDTKNANVVDGTCIGGSSGPISSCMEPHDLTTKGQAINDEYYQSGQTHENAIMHITNSGGDLKNQSMNYHSFHNGQTEDIVMSKNDITKNANEVDGTCIGVSSGPISSCMELDRLTAQNKESAVQPAKMACDAKCADGGKAHTGGVNQDAIAGSSLPVVPLQFNSENNDRLYQVTESKKPALLQASLRVLQNKRNELCQQQRVITDEIAQCEMNIQTVLTEGKDSLTSNVEPIIEALNILCSSQVQPGANVSSKERSSLQWLKRRKISEAIFSSKNPCQELDDICDNNCWTLPRYSVLPSGRLFQAKVTVVGTDFNFTCDGDLKSSPSDARESASTNMLLKLRSMAGQRQ